MVKDYHKPKSLDEALKALTEPGTRALAGGTFLLAGYASGKTPDLDALIDIEGLLPRGIEAVGKGLRIGAGITFQELVDAPLAPACLKQAALGMANRNTRNRATLGGNLGANKSCASLIPLLLALGSTVEYRTATGSDTQALDAWLAKPEGLALSVSFPLPSGVLAGYVRSARTTCDIATASVGVAYGLKGGNVEGLRIGLGGFGPHARLFPELAALFEGKALPDRASIESAVEPLLTALSDARGSAAYKKRRGAVALADALHQAEALA